MYGTLLQSSCFPLDPARRYKFTKKKMEKKTILMCAQYFSFHARSFHTHRVLLQCENDNAAAVPSPSGGDGAPTAVVRGVL